MSKTWYEKVKENQRKENAIPNKPKKKGTKNCPGCGEDLGFVLITTKNGNWVNDNWCPGDYFHCLKHEQLS